MPNAAKAKHRVSARAKRIWDKLQNWYGDQMDQYGPFAPIDWCEAIDAMDDEVESRVMDEVRIKHRLYPPRFPQFDEIVARLRNPTGIDRVPSIFERLSDRMLRLHGAQMSAMQLARPMNFVRGTPISLVSRAEPIALVCDADPDADRPAYRVRVEDLILEGVELTTEGV